LLHAAQHHQATEEESDQQALAQHQAVLVGRVSGCHAHEQQEYRDEGRRVMGKEDDGQQEQQMAKHHRQRHTAVGRFGRVLQAAQFTREQEGHADRIDQHRHGGLPADMGQHVAEVKAPGLGDHQHRRRGIGRERATDRDVDEQRAERGVLQRRGSARKDGVLHQQRGQGHRGRLGDEGAQQRHDRQRGEEEGHGTRQRNHPHDGLHGNRGRLQHGATAGDDHDREHEQRFGEVAAVEVGQRLAFAHHEGHHDHQDHGPEAKDDLDLGQQMPDAGMGRAGMRQVLEVLGREGVQQRQGKNGGGNKLDLGW
jgi:hypothetical protein